MQLEHDSTLITLIPCVEDIRCMQASRPSRLPDLPGGELIVHFGMHLSRASILQTWLAAQCWVSHRQLCTTEATLLGAPCTQPNLP